MTHPATPADDPGRDRDRGSVTPLIIGMVVCLLLLGVGVIAAGSAVLARRDLQSACDGAVDAVTGQVVAGSLSGGSTKALDRLAAAYLTPRLPGTRVVTAVDGDAVTATCSRSSPIALGALFGSPIIDLGVRSVSQLVRR